MSVPNSNIATRIRNDLLFIFIWAAFLTKIYATALADRDVRILLRVRISAQEKELSFQRILSPAPGDHHR